MKKDIFSLFGILGYPLSHSLSPVMQEAAFQKIGVNAFYLTLELGPQHIKKVLKQWRQTLIQGANVTVPYKETVIPYLDRLTPEAKVIGAVNTIYRRGKLLVGANTDAVGFLKSLKADAHFNVKGKRVLILGAGGSARAILYAVLAEKASSVCLMNRTTARAHKLIKGFRTHFPGADMVVEELTKKNIRRLIVASDLIVNTTSVGLKAKDVALVAVSDIPKATSKQKKVFYDLIYKPERTKFLLNAKKKKHVAVNGLGMLLAQGERSFEYWTNKKAPHAAMQMALKEALNG